MASFIGRGLWVVVVLVATLFASRDAWASACCPVTQESCVVRPNHPDAACRAGKQPYVKEAAGPCTCCSTLCLFDCEGCLLGPHGDCAPVIVENSVQDLCDGIDNDCDGQTDEDGKSVEVCDGKDNNCNGSIDEQFPFHVMCGGQGACAGSQTFTCVEGKPGATACVGVTAPTVEVCDGYDNNCNGVIDEQFPFHVTCGGQGACAGSQTFTCVDGVPGATACIGASAPTTEVPDGYDNDCDGQVDECEGPNDFWCGCAGQDLTFTVDRLDDGADPDAEAAACLPGAQSTGNCRLRGVFRRAEQLHAVGCGVVANLPVGSIVIGSELRLRHGELTLRGVDACSTAITTQSPCAKGDCLCGSGTQHRLVNAIREGGNSLELVVDGVTLRGGRSTVQANFGPTSASGGIVIEHGDLTLLRAVVEDNRAFGHGSGIASYDGGLLRVVESVIRDNMNLQAISDVQGQCITNQDAGGQTGMGGGIFAQRTAQLVVENSSITGNRASDGGGIYVAGGALSITNSTIGANHVGGQGAGLMSEALTTTLAFSTFTENVSGGDSNVAVWWGSGFRILSGSLAAYGNLIAQNHLRNAQNGPIFGRSQDCSIDSDVTVTAGANLVGYGGDDCAALGATTNPLIGPDPGFPTGIQAQLQSLPEDQCPTTYSAFYGLGASSPARGAYPAGATPACTVDDQRHYGRAVSQCTLGSIEPSGAAAFRRIEVTSCAYASQTLTLRDRADIDGDAYAGSFSVANDSAIFGTLLSVGNGWLGDRAIVDGDAALRGDLTGNAAGVFGDLVESVSVPAQSLAVRTVSSSGSAITVGSDATKSLAAGSYGNVLVRSRGKLKLTQSGLYRFASLTFEPDALLDVPSGSPSIALAAAGNAVFGDRFRVTAAGQSTPNLPTLFVYSNGSRIELGHDAVMVANLEAPSGLIELRDRSVLLGCAGGKNLTIGHDASVGDGKPAVVPLPPWSTFP